MAPGSAERRLATVVFVDMVGSTRIASDIGDERWEELLRRFRRIVRGEIKRFGGHEVDTAGDGFLMTFGEPGRAVRAAAAMATAVQELGVDIRAGMHTGEAQPVDGKLAGIAVHIGARVMSLAGPAEILVTSTVRDLTAGSGLEFADLSHHELKGVPGTWQLFAVTRIDANAATMALPAATAVERIAAIRPAPPARRRTAFAAAGIGVVVLGSALFLLLGGRDHPVAQPTARPTGPSPAAGSDRPVTMVRIDPATDGVTTSLADRAYSFHMGSSLWSVGGALWQATPDHLVRRDIRTGAIEDSIPMPSAWSSIAFGFGSVWIGGPGQNGNSVVTRIDQVTGRRQARIPVRGPLATIAQGDQEMWFVTREGTLARIDPLKNEVVQPTYKSGAFTPGAVIALAGKVWVCDCVNHQVIGFDPVKNKVVHRVTLPERGYLFGVESTEDGETMWLLDPVGRTLTPLDADTGEEGQPLGVPGDPGAATIAFGSIWVASGHNVYRIDLGTHEQTRIAMPPGVSAAGIAFDTPTRGIWVENCGCTE